MRALLVAGAALVAAVPTTALSQAPSPTSISPTAQSQAAPPTSISPTALSQAVPTTAIPPAAHSPTALPHAEADDRAQDGLFARVHTNRGLITLRLEHQRAPLATAAFVGLAEGTIENAAFELGRPYYDGTPFHRVVPGHVIQAGAPTAEGVGSPGWAYPNEIHAQLSHDQAGMLGVANSGPHTNSGQFYVTLGDRSYLDGDYIVFGQVTEGMDVVFAVEQGDVVDSVRIVRVGPEAEAFRPDTERFRAMVRQAEARVAEHDEARLRTVEEWLVGNLGAPEGDTWPIEAWPTEAWPIEAWTAQERPTEARPGDPGAVVGAPWPDAAPPPGTRWVRYRGVALRYQGHFLGHDGPPVAETPFASGEEGTPGARPVPAAFPFAPDQADALPPGLRDALAELAPGESRVVAVPPEEGYGRSGFYGAQRPGEPRFAIYPASTLVYLLEAAPERDSHPSSRL